jgi:hypothetical protein
VVILVQANYSSTAKMPLPLPSSFASAAAGINQDSKKDGTMSGEWWVAILCFLEIPFNKFRFSWIHHTKPSLLI